MWVENRTSSRIVMEDMSDRRIDAAARKQNESYVVHILFHPVWEFPLIPVYATPVAAPVAEAIIPNSNCTIPIYLLLLQNIKLARELKTSRFIPQNLAYYELIILEKIENIAFTLYYYNKNSFLFMCKVSFQVINKRLCKCIWCMNLQHQTSQNETAILWRFLPAS